MKLKIDSSSLEVSLVALEDKGKYLAHQESKRSPRSQILTKLIVELLRDNKINLAELDEIEIVKGPGSFTSLRVGAAVANALAYGLGIQVNQKTSETELVYK